MANEIRIIITGEDRASAPLDKVQQKSDAVASHIGISMGRISTATVAMGVALGETLAHIAERTAHLGKELVVSYAEAGSQINDLRLRTGFTAEGLSELGFAAKLSGTNLEGL